MKKHYFVLSIYLLFSMISTAETVVYVGGTAIDGTEEKSVYWRNGIMYALPERTYGYGGFAVENGNTYLCSYSKDHGSFYVYENLSPVPMEKRFWYSSKEEIWSFNVLNGSYYVLTSYDDYYSNRKTRYRNDNEVEKDVSTTQLYVYDGYLYEVLGDRSNYYYMIGYSAAGNFYRNSSSMDKNFRVYNMRVIDGNAYFMGKDSKGACIQTNNERRNYFTGYGEQCQDFAIVAGKSFWIIDNKLIDSNGNTIINDGALQIIGYDNKLYVLGRTQQGAIKQVYYLIIDPYTNHFSQKKFLPSCRGAGDFVVVDEY